MVLPQNTRRVDTCFQYTTKRLKPQYQEVKNNQEGTLILLLNIVTR